jgi:hypothetical protein
VRQFDRTPSLTQERQLKNAFKCLKKQQQREKAKFEHTKRKADISTVLSIITQEYVAPLRTSVSVKFDPIEYQSVDLSECSSIKEELDRGDTKN